MKRSNKIILVICVCLIAFALRFYRLGSVPASMNADEVAIGYNAYSILKTGKDEYGVKYPLLFRSFDDYKLPLYIYISVPSVAAFGLTDFAVRLPSALFGVATVFATFMLVRVLFSSFSVAIVSAALLAISPWHLHFSRSAYEANSAVFFIVTGVTLLLMGLKNGKYYIPAFFSLGLATWAYHSPRIFVPLLLLGFISIYFQEIKKHSLKFLLGLGIFLLIFAPLVMLSISPEGLVRARGVSALGDEALAKRNVSWRITDIATGIPLSNIFHNQRFVGVSIILKGYLDHFNPNFFFSEIVQAKYHTPGIGLMYLWELPILLYGLHIVAGKKGKEKLLLFMWLLLAPVAAAPTQMLPHPVRTIVFLPALQVFVAVGLWGVLQKVKDSKIAIITRVIGAIVIAASLGYYLHQYYIHGPIDNALDWQYGHEQVVKSVSEMQDQFDKVIVSTTLDQPYIFFLYYLKYDPAKYLAQGGTTSGKFDEERNAFDKYEFHAYMKSNEDVKPTKLYVGTPSEMKSGTGLLKGIYDPSGQLVYGVYAAISKADWNKAGNTPYLE